MNTDTKVVNLTGSATFLFQRAQKSLTNGRLLDALDLMKMSVAKEPDNRGYRIALAELQMQLGNMLQSLGILLDLYAGGDRSEECLNALAKAFSMIGSGVEEEIIRREMESSRAGKPSGLESLLRFILKKVHPRMAVHSHKLAQLAQIRSIRGDYDRADICAARAQKLMPDSESLKGLQLAIRLKKNPQDQVSRKGVEKLFLENQDDPSVLGVCAKCYGIMGDNQGTEKCLDRIESLDSSDNAAPNTLLAKYCEEFGQTMRAYRMLQKEARQNPYCVPLLINTALTGIRAGAPDAEILQYWQTINRIEPEDYTAPYFIDALTNGTLDPNECGSIQGIPPSEEKRRFYMLHQSAFLTAEQINQRWNEDIDFRTMLRWAICLSDPADVNRAIKILAQIHDPSAVTIMRYMLVRPEPKADRLAAMLKIIKDAGGDVAAYMPLNQNRIERRRAAEIIHTLPLYDRCVIRECDLMLRNRLGVELLPEIAKLWNDYRKQVPIRTDPIINGESAEAALAVNVLNHKSTVAEEKVVSWFGCGMRAYRFAKRRLDKTVSRLQEEL